MLEQNANSTANFLPFAWVELSKKLHLFHKKGVTNPKKECIIYLTNILGGQSYEKAGLQPFSSAV